MHVVFTTVSDRLKRAWLNTLRRTATYNNKGNSNKKESFHNKSPKFLFNFIFIARWVTATLWPYC